jgi:hypothetical protein|tara:strand:+ start:16 stop:693 length:678 start_codon:yes stop_codon:yes gene_type:complete
MINFPEIELKDKNILIIIFVIALMLFFFNYLDIKVLISILVIFYIINQYPNLKKNINENILDKNNKSKIPIKYNHKISKLLSKLKKYKKKSPYNYKQGMYYWTQFMKLIDLLEKDDLHHYNQYFENAHHYLQKATNTFQSLGIEAEERKYIQALKFNDFENSKELSKISKVSKQLHQEGYLLLYNLSLRLNKKWERSPSVFNNQIVLDHPMPNDKFLSNNFDFYL